MPSSGPRSQWALGSKSKLGGEPTRRTSTLSSAVLPAGTDSCGALGIEASRSLKSATGGSLVRGHGFVRDVGDRGEQLLKARVEGLDLLIERGDPGLHGAHLFLLLSGIGALTPPLAHLSALLIDASLQLLGLGDGGAAGVVELTKLVQAGYVAARGKAFGNALEVGAEV